MKSQVLRRVCGDDDGGGVRVLDAIDDSFILRDEYSLCADLRLCVVGEEAGREA